jgi:hypothetical protein
MPSLPPFHTKHLSHQSQQISHQSPITCHRAPTSPTPASSSSSPPPAPAVLRLSTRRDLQLAGPPTTPHTLPPKAQWMPRAPRLHPLGRAGRATAPTAVARPDPTPGTPSMSRKFLDPGAPTLCSSSNLTTAQARRGMSPTRVNLPMAAAAATTATTSSLPFAGTYAEGRTY